METQLKTSGSAKDFFINLGAIVALYTLVVSLLNLLFTIINTIYPKITNGYSYLGSQSISWPVATLVIFFPVFIFLMWLMEKEYIKEPEKKNRGIHKWLTYLTLFISGLVVVGDLVTVLYYFLDGQEMTTGFLLKVLVLLIVTFSVFAYYISDVLGRLTSKSRKVWRIAVGVIVLGSIIWGFSVLGSPATQRLYKYDEQKVNDLININNEITNYYATQEALPESLNDISTQYYIIATDPQTRVSYEYEKTGDKTYNLCAEFNKGLTDEDYRTRERIFGGVTWTHPEGQYCFERTISSNTPFKPLPVR